MKLGIEYTLLLLQMTKFWRLFTSTYVQDFVDSLSITTSDELAEIFIGSNFDDVLNSYKNEASKLFEQIPTFQQIYGKVRNSTIDQLEKNK